MITVKRIFLAATACVVLFVTGCAKDINNKEALRTALIDYYNSNQAKMGLNMSMMDVEIGSMTFSKDEAQAMVSIKPKAGGEGMQVSKVFERKGDKWVVKGNQSAGPGGHGAGMAIPESAPGGAGGALPPGHPAVSGAK